MKKLNKVDDFFNKAAKRIDKKYFPEVKYYRDDKDNADVHYALECFSNGVFGYTFLIKKLAKSCNDTQENLHDIVKDFITDFGDYNFTPNYEEDAKKWPASMFMKSNCKIPKT